MALAGSAREAIVASYKGAEGAKLAAEGAEAGRAKWMSSEADELEDDGGLKKGWRQVSSGWE